MKGNRVPCAKKSTHDSTTYRTQENKMSFNKMKTTIEYGDTVLLYVGYDNMLPVVMSKGKTHQTKFGAVRHDSLIGRQYGTRVQCSKGWIYVLHPTPELWTLSLPHRTQILYSTDISMVIFQLDLKPGSVIVEAGTGSGSLSHAFLRTIQPSGHLHTFEFHEERSIKARDEFAAHGLSEFVTVTHRDVCADGFQLVGLADAVFLDLPRPWECIESSKIALKKEGGRFCTFSPCIEQVQRSCDELREHGFTDIVTMECLVRNFNIQYAKLQNLTFGDGEHRADEITSDKLKFQSEKPDAPSDQEDRDGCPPSKQLKPEEDDVKELKGTAKCSDKKGKPDLNIHNFTTAVPALNMQGHTGFLTFATLLSH